MFSLNNQPIHVGDEVYILEVPIVGQHKFVRGKVLKITEKQVVVESSMKDRWSGNTKREVKRYPEQVIVMDW